MDLATVVYDSTSSACIAPARKFYADKAQLLVISETLEPVSIQHEGPDEGAFRVRKRKLPWTATILGMEHDHILGELLKPDLEFNYKDEEEPSKIVFESAQGRDTVSRALNGHTIIEADISTERAAFWKEPRELSDTELSTWIKEYGFNDSVRNQARILFTRPIQFRPPAVSVSETFMRSMAEYFIVPAEFHRALHRGLPIAVQFESHEIKSGSKVSGLIMRNQSAWLIEFTLLHIYVPSRNSSISICFNLAPIRIHKLLVYLASSQRSGVCHLLFPLLLVDETIEATSSCIQRRREAIEYMQHETKLNKFLKGYKSEPTKGEQTDMDEISKHLTSFSTSIATLVCATKAHRIFVKVLGKMIGSSPECSPEFNEEMQAFIMPSFRARLEYLKSLTVSIEDEGDFLQTSIQSQVQTVHNLIAQSDANVQRKLSQLSTRVAELTQRDSSDMRVIAGVTLLFLPATFTATLFSTSFFDFKPDPGSHVMSHWFWLYWVVAVSLTLVVMAAWLYTAHQESNNLTARLQPKADGEKSVDGGAKVKDDVEKVDQRFQYVTQDIQLLKEHLEEVIAASNKPVAQPKDPVVTPVPKRNKGKNVQRNVVNNSSASQRSDSRLSNPASSTAPELGVQTNHNVVLESPQDEALTEEQMARLQEIAAKELKVRLQKDKIQRNLLVSQEIRRRQPPPRTKGM